MIRVITTHRLQSALAGLVLVVLLLFAAGWTIFVRDGRPADVREFSAIRDDWERAVAGRAMSGRVLPGMSPPKATAPLQGNEKLAADQRLVERCLEVAEKHPNTAGELGALYLAACRGPEIDLGKRAQEMLLVRMETADLMQLQQGISQSRLSGPDAARVNQAIAPSIISRVKERPGDPSAAALLTCVCLALGSGSEMKTPPPHFTELADLIAANYAASPGIHNFCMSLGGMNPSPSWASEFEAHLRAILEVNQDRGVRCTASLALASVVQLSVDRQTEAKELYEKFLAEFDGQHEYMFQNVEQVLYAQAKDRLLSM
ncbi:MAG: hypothetical protein H8E66_27020 [Planctomycetes bacterium]|nr:hypothetical protein [Planctomycetota bacterium]